MKPATFHWMFFKPWDSKGLNNIDPNAKCSENECKFRIRMWNTLNMMPSVSHKDDNIHLNLYEET